MAIVGYLIVSLNIFINFRAHSSVISKRKAFFYILELSSVTFIYFATIASATRRVITSSDSVIDIIIINIVVNTTIITTIIMLPLSSL